MPRYRTTGRLSNLCSRDKADAKKLKMYLAAADKMLGDKPYLLYSEPTYADVHFIFFPHLC